MGKGLPRSLSKVKNRKDGTPFSARIPISGTITVDGASGVGFGTLPIGKLPEGNVAILSAVSYLVVSGSGAEAGLGDTWAGDYGIGTTPADDATISAADIDIIQSTEIAAATDEVSPRTRGTIATASAGQVVDNSDDDVDLNLNVLIDDADISADGIDLTVDGVLYLTLAVLGDD